MEQPFQLNIELYSEELQSTVVEVLVFSSFPATFRDIMNRVEESLSIPCCSQVIIVQGSRIQDPEKSKPSSFYLQSGDTIKISYPMKCECDQVKEAVRWIAEGVTLFEKTKEFVNDEESASFYQEQELHMPDNMIQMECLNNLFSPWSDKVKSMNCFYFDYLGGIELLVKFHGEVRVVPSLGDSDKLNLFRTYALYLEHLICSMFTMIARNGVYCRRITECGGLECCIDTFLKYAADKSLDDHETVIGNSLQAIGNISDIPENHYYISQRRDVIDNVIAIISTPASYSNDVAFIAVNLLLNLAQCKKAHVNLLQPEIVESVISSLQQRWNLFNKDELSIKMLNFYAGVSLAQMVLGSTQLLQKFPEATLLKITTLLSTIQKYNPDDIKNYELQAGAVWDSFQYLAFLYQPESMPFNCGPKQLTDCIKQLHWLSIEILLISLQSTIGREEHIKIVEEENLLEYIVMLPWSVPPSSHDRAKYVVQELARVYQIQPPSLCSLAKGKLAKTSVPLKNIIGMTSTSDILSQIFS